MVAHDAQAAANVQVKDKDDIAMDNGPFGEMSIIRNCHYFTESRSMLTADEDGMIKMWTRKHQDDMHDEEFSQLGQLPMPQFMDVSKFEK